MLPFLSQPAVAPACYVPRDPIGQSQLFKGGQYFSRTPAIAGNTKLGTFNADFQRAKLGTATNDMVLFGADAGVGNFLQLRISASTSPQNTIYVAGAGGITVFFGSVLRDPNAFSNIHWVIDTAQATPSDRLQVYLNGSRLPVTAGTTPVWPALNADLSLSSTIAHHIGRLAYGSTTTLEGLLAPPYYVNGVALPPTVFGEPNIHGVWVRKMDAEISAAIAAAGGFGVTGFHLDFAAPLNSGNDVSGQGNHFTPSGFDLAGKDTVTSTPTNVYAAWNALAPGAVALSNGNTTAYYNASGANSLAVTSLFVRSGKYRAQVMIDTANMFIGVVGTSVGTNSAPSAQSPAVWYRSDNGQILVNGVASIDATAYVAQNVITIDLDLDGQTVEFSKNGVSQGVIALPVSNQPWAFACSQTGLSVWRATINCGQSSGYTASPVYLPLCTDNLPEPDIKDPAEGYAAATGADILTLLDTATAHWSGQWVEIIKRRDAVEDWRLRFSDDPGNAIASNNANAKGAAPVLVEGGSYMGYRLRVGRKYGVWTGEVAHVLGTATTVTHGLATARNAVLATRVSVGGGDRYFRHPDMTTDYLGKLNSNAVVGADGALTAFSANNFQIAATAPSGTYRVLVLAERYGYLNLPKWVGNGSAIDGAFVPMDISPLLMISRQLGGGTTGTGDWEMLSDVTSPANPRNRRLSLNTSAPEDTSGTPADFVVGGVKMRDTNADWNGNTVTSVGIAIGRPIGGVCVAPATAR